ncbi:MAG: NAD(P)H-dependent oxidoreductase [Clostridia bacterium]|nr:NAD(P)H-dependent oxidoreductase [Clostridia bacterium]
MHILVVNGSPKGEYSVTLQTVKYLEKAYPDYAFSYLAAGQRIRALEKDFSEAESALKAADMILFSYPVYTFIAPSQLHRFFELIKERNIDLSGKWATQITTSKHFYDVTAHKYVEENCLDLGMKVIKGLSADMDDLLSEKGRKEARAFFEYAMFSVQNGIFEKIPAAPEAFAPVIAAPGEKPASSLDKEVVLVTDAGEKDVSLNAMIDRFKTVSPFRVRVINLWETEIRGGCLGCFGCAVSGKCVYTDRFDEYLRNTIQSADAIVYAFTIRDHSMGARFKMYDDRQFCNGHRTVTMGAPTGYLISGAYSEEANVKTIVEARAQVGGNFLCGAATDETDPDKEIDSLAKTLAYAFETNLTQPSNFYGVGGMKIFRDLIWLMQGFMKADHKFYKSHGQYDFPQKKRGTMLRMYLVGALISNSKIKAKMGNAMYEGMLMPYKKMFEKEFGK